MLKSRRLLSAFIVLSFMSQLAVAGNNSGDWNNVRILEIGTTIVVKTKSGERYEGVMKSATADSLSVAVDVSRSMRKVIDIRRDEVREVKTRLPRVTSTVIGAGVGLGVGLGLGAIVDSRDRYSEDPGLGKFSLGSLGLLFGMIAGSGLSLVGRTVYRAP